ncbi:MAG TPA: hypothetical protein VIE41_06630, partial [Methylomirabilota bacterium]
MEVPARLRTARAWRKLGGRLGGQRPVEQISRGTQPFSSREKTTAMELDPQTMKSEATYKLLIGCVVPRPIAWVSTVGADGVNNLAPFSFFMGVCQEPPTIAFSSG